MLTAKYNHSKQGIECEVEGTTMELAGEFAAMIRGAREALIKKYDSDAVDETKIVDNETILHKFPPIRWEPAACPNCGAHIEGLRYRGREAEIDRQGLEHRELSAGFKEWKYEK